MLERVRLSLYPHPSWPRPSREAHSDGSLHWSRGKWKGSLLDGLTLNLRPHQPRGQKMAQPAESCNPDTPSDEAYLLNKAKRRTRIRPSAYCGTLPKLHHGHNYPFL